MNKFTQLQLGVVILLAFLALEKAKFKSGVEVAEMGESSFSPGESLFLVPFNLFYYFGFVPFKTQHNQETNRYKLHTHFVQKVICLFWHIVLITNQIYYLIIGCMQFKEDSETNLVTLFDSVSNFTYTGSILLLMFHIWRQQQGYLNFLEYSRSKKGRGWCMKKGVQLGFVVLCIFNIVGSWFLINDSGHFFSQSYAYNSTTNTHEIENVTAIGNESYHKNDFRLDYYINFGKILLYLHSAIFFGFTNGLFYLLTFALGQLGTEFRSELQKTRDEFDFEKGIQLYRKLKETTNFIRKMYGDYVLAFYISTLTYCVQAPHIWLGKRGDTEKVILIVFTFTNIVWICVAEFHHSVQTSIVEWISFYSACESLSLENRLKLLSIRCEASTEPVALSCRCFSVTYKHLSSMLGVVATYGVIVIQLNQN